MSDISLNHEWLLHDSLGELRQLRSEVLAGGRSVVDLSMINPDLAPARLLLDKLVEASMKSESHRYAVSRGVRKLREAFGYKYGQKFGVPLDPESSVCVTLGSKDALYRFLDVCVKEGDKVAVPSPAYPAFIAAVRLKGAIPVFYSVTLSEQETLESISKLLVNEDPKALLLNFPNNPVGSVVSSKFYEELLPFCSSRNVLVFNDFVYGEMTFEREQGATSALCRLNLNGSAMRGVVESFSLSKAYSVPGWRVGCIVGDPLIVDRLQRLKGQCDYGVFLPIQYAACAALMDKGAIVRSAVATYAGRLKLLQIMLSRCGMEIYPPSAGASIWIKLPMQLDGASFCKNLLKNFGVVLLPGITFGNEFANFIRIAAVASEEKLRQVSEYIVASLPQAADSRADLAQIASNIN